MDENVACTEPEDGLWSSPAPEVPAPPPRAPEAAPHIQLHGEFGDNRFGAGVDLTTDGVRRDPVRGPVHAEGRGSLDASAGVEGGTGTWVDRDGNENHGTRVQGGARLRFSDDHQPGPYHGGVDVGALTFDAGGYTSENESGLGVTANLGEVGADFGTTLTPENRNDAGVRLEVSAGVGLGVRLHHGDEDHDGAPEAGFGFDVGPASVDVTSETLGRVLTADRPPTVVCADSGPHIQMPEMPIVGTEARILDRPVPTGLEGCLANEDAGRAQVQRELAQTPLVQSLGRMGSTEYASHYAE